MSPRKAEAERHWRVHRSAQETSQWCAAVQRGIPHAQQALKEILLRVVRFSKAEAERYLEVHQEAKQKDEFFQKHGVQHITRHLLSIMSLLGPLRCCCSGGALRKRVSTSACGLPNLYCVRVRHPVSDCHALAVLQLLQAAQKCISALELGSPMD